MNVLRVPNKLLKRIEQEKGMPFLVSVTARMIGEMSSPSSMLVDSDKIPDEARQLLIEYGCKKIEHLREAVASLGGKNVRPLEPGHFQGVVAVPKKYFEGRTDLEALLGFLEDDNWEDNFL